MCGSAECASGSVLDVPVTIALVTSTKSPPKDNIVVAARIAPTPIATSVAFIDIPRLYRSAIDIFDEFRPKEDANVFDCYIKIGDIHMLQNNPDDALEGFKAASGIALENTNRERGVRWQGRLASSYVKIGDALVAQGLLDRAITEYERALRITTALAELYPQSPEWTFKKEELNKKIQILASGAYQ